MKILRPHLCLLNQMLAMGLVAAICLFTKSPL
jgi:hypothetical protein